MSDSAEFEKLTALEARLARALDRLATGISARPDAGAGSDAEVQAALSAAEARADELAGRVSMLEGQLTETQSALSEAQAQALSAAHAAADEPAADPEEVADLKARLDVALAKALEAEAALAAQEEAATPASESDLARRVASLERRVARSRQERDEARDRADAAQDQIDEMIADGTEEPDARVLTLRREVRMMRERAESLAAEVATLTGGAGQAEDLEQGLLAEVQTLRQLREVEAAELQRIVADMEQGLAPAGGMTHG